MWVSSFPENASGTSASLELRVDLGGETLRRAAVGSDARAPPLSVLPIAEIPDPTTQVPSDATDPERPTLLWHGRESFRYKPPQKPPQKGIPEVDSGM